MPTRRETWVIVGAVVIAVVLVAIVLGVPPRSESPSTSPTFPTEPVSIGGVNGSIIQLDGGFLGANLRADLNFTSGDAALLNATGVRMVRFPGGGLGDRFDPLANGGRGLIHRDNGQAVAPGTTLAQFVDWCRSVSCKSIITLPAELDNASMASAIVSYTENSLGFHPTYWEIGNEPARWEHFDIPWNQWNSSQNATPTPAEYTEDVQSYVQAIHSVDPTAAIIGIGGIGKGGSELSEWFAPTLTLNGPNLSAMAIHVYPAGSGFPSSDLRAWYGTLGGSTGLPHRVRAAQAEMSTDCPGCPLALLVDEFQTGTNLSPNTSLSGGYLATYIAAELVESLSLSLASIDYFGVDAWFNESGASPSYALYAGLEMYLGTYAVQVNVSSSTPGLFAAEGGTSSDSMVSLLLANTNSTLGFYLNLQAQFPNAAQGTAWVFNGPSNEPFVVPIGLAGAQNWTVPPASLVLLSGIGPYDPSIPIHDPSGPAGSSLVPGPTASANVVSLGRPTPGVFDTNPGGSGPNLLLTTKSSA